MSGPFTGQSPPSTQHIFLTKIIINNTIPLFGPMKIPFPLHPPYDLDLDTKLQILARNHILRELSYYIGAEEDYVELLSIINISIGVDWKPTPTFDSRNSSRTATISRSVLTGRLEAVRSNEEVQDTLTLMALRGFQDHLVISCSVAFCGRTVELVGNCWVIPADRSGAKLDLKNALEQAVEG